MILINEKEYLNLQEQVWKNTETIRCLLSGLKITGTGPTLPPDPEDQDAFLLQQDGKTYLSIYFEADQAWANLGEYPAVGPQGIPGPQGSAATIGAVECSTRTISAGDSASVEVSVDGTNLHFDFEIPQGAVGAQGPRGERGPQGLTGETGPRGPQGETGSSISIAGTLTSSSNLPDPETVPATTAYLVGLTAPYNLYVIVGAAGSRLWKDVGAVTPQNITVDASMSGSSQNPVQNRVVKAYVDPIKTTAEAAYTRSSSNLGRINAIQNVDLPDIYYELADLKEIVFETVAAAAAYVVDPVDEFTVPSYITIDNVAYPVIDSTDAEVAEILGSTVVWNQLLRTISATGRGLTVTKNEDGSLTVTGTATEGGYIVIQGVQDPASFVAGHAYLLFGLPSGLENIVLNRYVGAQMNDTGSGAFMTATASSGYADPVRLLITQSGTTYNFTFTPAFVDLTAAIPTNTPTEISDDRVQQLIRYAKANPAYAAPALLDFEMKSITSSKAGEDWESSIDWESVIADSEKLTARSAGTARDVIYVRDDGNDTFSIVKRKVIGTYTFTGNELFSENGPNTGTFDVTPSFLTGAKTYTANDVAALLIVGYVPASANAQGQLQVALYGSTLRFKNAAEYAGNTTGFKASLAGKTIYFEIAYPEETVLASGLLYDHVSFLIKKGGTIAINGGVPDALPGIEIDIPVKRFNE